MDNLKQKDAVIRVHIRVWWWQLKNDHCAFHLLFLILNIHFLISHALISYNKALSSGFLAKWSNKQD